MNILCTIFFLLTALPTGRTAEINLTSSGDSLHIFYYSSIQFAETPLSPILGSVPLEKAEAMTRNHYRFTYDQQHRLLSVAFYNGDYPRAPNHTANLFILSHRLELAYRKNAETITFFDREGVPVPVLGNCYAFEYVRNEEGYRTGLYFLDQSGKRVVNDWGIYEYEWSYEGDGSVIERRFDAVGNLVAIRPGFEFYQLRLRFNPFGQIALMQQIDSTGNLVENSTGAAQDRIRTNAQGNFLEWNVLDKDHQLERGNGPDVAVGIQRFNRYGYEIALENQDEHRKPITSKYGICRSETSFDRFGNLWERRFYDEQGLATSHSLAGYHHLVISWEKTGNHRETLQYFGTEGQPVLHTQRGYHAVRYAYDEGQRLSKLSYHDTDGALVNRRDNGVAYILYRFDEKTRQTDIQRFDLNGRSLQ